MPVIDRPFDEAMLLPVFSSMFRKKSVEDSSISDDEPILAEAAADRVGSTGDGDDVVPGTTEDRVRDRGSGGRTVLQPIVAVEALRCGRSPLCRYRYRVGLSLK